MPEPSDRCRLLNSGDDRQRERFVESLGHVGLMPMRPGDPAPEERRAEDQEFMETLDRPRLGYLRERKRQGEDTGELEEFRRREGRRRDSEMQRLSEALSSDESHRRVATHPTRCSRPRTRRVGCPRRRGSRRSTATGSRDGPSDDPGESDPGDHHFPLVAGDTRGAAR